MMYSSFPHGGVLGIFLLLRGIFSISAVAGAVFLFAWTIKHLPAQKLKHLALWLLAVGIVGVIFMSFFSFKMGGGFGPRKMMRGDGMMQREAMNRGTMIK